MEDDRARTAAAALVSDPRLIELRISACVAAVGALTAAALYLHVPAFLEQDARIRGLSVVLDISAELSSSTVDLFKRQEWYSGNALVRQVIECEYLLTLFANDRNSAATWFKASPQELRKWWTPSEMRARTGGRFADKEYWDHCERGGHPVPAAKLFLRGNVAPPFDRRFWWIDLAGHLRRMFTALESCFVALGYSDRLREDAYLLASAALNEWKAEDPAPEFLQDIIRKQHL